MKMATADAGLPQGFDTVRWQALDTAPLDPPWLVVAPDVRRSSAGRSWRGLAVWHQVGPAGDLYVPPHHSHCILLRRSTPTALLQCHGRATGQGRWQPGDAVILPAGVPSFWRSPSQRDNVHINLDPAWLQRAAGGSVRLPSCFGRPDPVLASFAEVLLASLDTNTSLHPSFPEHVALGIALHLLEHYAAPMSAPQPALTRRQMDALVEAVNANLDEGWPLSRLAALVGLSPFHFSRAFKASFGRTPHAYVSAQRMEAAARMISGTRKPLGDIARACGYGSSAHFAQAFRRHWGLTPTDYRRSR